MWVEKHTRRMISYTYCKDLRETQILLYALKKYGFCLNQSLDIRQELGLALILVKISTYFEQNPSNTDIFSILSLFQVNYEHIFHQNVPFLPT